MIKAIASATTHSELKVLGVQLFAMEQSDDKKGAITAYKLKRKELDAAMVAAAPKGSVLAKALYHVNTMGKEGKVTTGKCGVILFDMCKNGKFTKPEADLIFRSFTYRKDMIAKASAVAAA